MVQHEALHQAAVLVAAVHHVHALHHVQVDGLPRPLHRQHRLRDDVRELVSHVWLQLGAQGSLGHAQQQLLVLAAHGRLVRVQEGQRRVLGHVQAVCHGARVHAVADDTLSVLQQLPREQDS